MHALVGGNFVVTEAEVMRMSKKVYTAGRLFWKSFSRKGYTLRIRVDIHQDEDTALFVAASRDLRGLVCESESLESLTELIELSVGSLLRSVFRTYTTPPYITELRYS